MAARPAIFLDRDGTLHRELESPLRGIDQIEWIPRALEALHDLARAGFELVVVTNQSAMARGELEWAELERIHEHMRSKAPIAAFYVCPHHPENGAPPYRRACQCRKPGSLLLSFAARDLGLDLGRSWIVGDARRDLQAGLALGVRALLVATGKGQRERAALSPEMLKSVGLCADLRAAADTILAQR